MRLPGPLFAFATVLLLSGCHSAYIDATISNRTAETMSLVEVDYPSASFGTQTLAPGHDFRYRFKILGSGPTTLLWTDSAHRDHKSSGPEMLEDEEGALHITFVQEATPTWDLRLNK